MPTPPTKQPTRRGRVPKMIRDQVDADLLEGTATWQDITDRYGVSKSYVGQRRKAVVSGSLQPRAVPRNTSRKAQRDSAEMFPDPIPLADLAPAPARALEDVEFFAARYYGIVLLPWQVEASAKILQLLESPHDEWAVINVAPGSGKAQPVDEPVLTPDGWTVMGALRPGDEVVGSDGFSTSVTGVFPQGERPVFEVEFSDGATVRADADHLWRVREKKGGSKTLTTAEIAERGVLRSDGGKRWFVPLVEPVHFRGEAPPIPAYSMGALLGDGCFRQSSITFSSEDDGILSRMEAELDRSHGALLKYDAGCNYRVVMPSRTGRGGSPLIDAVKALGLWRTSSVSKFIPTEYAQATVQDRRDLLAGLLDTDGCVTSAGTAEFTTVSPHLRDGVVELTRSLGGLATVRTKTPTYWYDGVRRTGQEAYTVLLDVAFNPFHLERKRRAWSAKADGRQGRRYVTGIRSVGEAECVCISVAAPDSLYVTKGFVLTHNSVFFGRILPAWLTCRDRAMRGLIGSATNTVAVKLVDLLRRDFTRPRVDNLSERDVKQGLIQAEAVLSQEFGRFRPDVDGHLWTRNAFEVAQHGDVSLTSKEQTWEAFGKDTTFVGMRVDFALWDDLWDPRKVRSQDAREDFLEWFDNVAEARMEPGGLFLLEGQRLGPNDIYRYALDKRDSGADLADWEQVPGGQEFQRKYHQIIYKAYDAAKDTGDPALLATDAPAWPDGPLLSPFRVSWRRLRQIRENKPDTFALVYQQEDHDLDSTLVNPLWIDGGQGPDGEIFPGCRDNERRMFEPPSGLRPPVVSVAMTDPSHTQMWGNVWALWQPGVPDQSPDVRHVMALKARKMTAPDFLQFNSLTNTFSGLMEEWWQISNEVGHPIKYWLVEQNGAQRYLLQYKFVHDWMALRGVRIIGHTTGRLKSDPDLGVQALAPVFRHGQIRLPMADALVARGPSKDPHMYELIKQVTQYSPGSGLKDDVVMALWFLEANMDRIRPRRGEPGLQARPSFLKSFERKEFAA